VFKSLTSSQPLKFKSIIGANPYFKGIFYNAGNSIYAYAMPRNIKMSPGFIL
jgi:hypothetical protein